MSQIKAVTPETLEQAASFIKEGALVAFPTETVYGLGANALDGKAVARIYSAKGRPNFNPLIVHFSSAQQAKAYAHFNTYADQITHKFWPGPLTIILPRKNGQKNISDLACAGLSTVALRVPDHPVALSLINACNLPLAAPSANRSEGLSPTTPAHVVESLKESVPLILADGRTSIGVESTILDLSTDTPVILRPGAITAEDIEDVIGIKIPYAHEVTHTPKAPGQTLRHYAPKTPVRINAIDIENGEALLGFGSIRFMGIRGGGAASSLPETAYRNLSEQGDLHEAAANLFAMLDELDRPDHKRIAVMPIPNTGIGIAINDRLSRATENVDS